jgi:3-hydroxy acid dehydrogenase/malonic semialdehyde reductase
LDVRSRSAVNGAIAALPDQLKNIDVLVNNAGLVIGLDKLSDVTEDAIDTMLDTNVKGLVYLTQAVLPGMKEQKKGHIINVGSVSGKNMA